MLLKRFMDSNAPTATILIRFMIGAVFLSEGIQKFLFPTELGIGRFIKIGLPIPEFLAPFVGWVEIIGGGFILLGFLTRLAAIPLVIDMMVAIMTTKIPILLKKGFWAMAHEARVDWSMLFGSLFLLLVGAGGWSLDSWLSKRKI